jgi:C1A family cysteine protease
MSLQDDLKHIIQKIVDVITGHKSSAMSPNQIMQYVCLVANIISKDVCPLVGQPPKESKYAKGWLKQADDPRDFPLSLDLRVALPESVDLRPEMPSVYDQMSLGSCTANAIAGAVQYLCLKENYKWKFTPSRLFLYYNERVVEGSVWNDAGASLRDGIKVLNSQGICPEVEGDGTNPSWLWSYSDDAIKFRLQPSHQCYQDAVLHKALKYEAVPQTLEAIQTCLANGLPVVFGIEVFDSFESSQVASTGVVPMPDTSKESLLGGHALLLVGYLPTAQVPGGTDPNGYFVFRNSWSSAWAAGGYGYIPYAYILDSTLTSDLWCVSLIGDRL